MSLSGVVLFLVWRCVRAVHRVWQRAQSRDVHRASTRELTLFLQDRNTNATTTLLCRKTRVASRMMDEDEQSRWTDEGIDCDTTLTSSLVTDEMSTARSVDIDDVDVTVLNQRKRRQRSPMVVERPKISTL